MIEFVAGLALGIAFGVGVVTLLVRRYLDRDGKVGETIRRLMIEKE